jgi:hypothetical protein
MTTAGTGGWGDGDVFEATRRKHSRRRRPLVLIG